MGDGGFDFGALVQVAAPETNDPATSEMALVSAVLADYDGSAGALARASAHVSPASFGDPRLAAMWRGLLALNDAGGAVNAAKLSEHLAATGQRAAVGYLGAVRRCGAAPANVEEHAKRVELDAVRREFAALLRDALAKVTGDGDPRGAVSDARAIVDRLPTGIPSARNNGIGAIAAAVYEEVDAYTDLARNGGLFFAKWGVCALDGDDRDDGALGGLFPPELILIGGVGGAGKTTLALQAALTTAALGLRVLYFSLEMTAKALTRRLVALRARVSPMRIKMGKCTDEEIRRLSAAARSLDGLPIEVIEDCRTTDEIHARVLAEKTRGVVALVVVDFLQLAQIARETDSNTSNEQRRVYDMKRTANVANVPVLAITSMTKDAQRKAAEGKVDMTSGSGSGSEYAADVYGFLVRTKPDDKGATPEVALDLVKVRDGDTSRPLMRFDKAAGRFVDHEDEGWRRRAA